jgi:integrase
MESSIPSASRFTPVAGHPGIAIRDGQYVVRSPHRTGRPSTFRTLKLALKEQAQRKGGAAAASMEPFEEYARRWIKRYEGRKTSFDESTRASYADALERIAAPYFGRKPLARITPPAVRGFYAHMRDELNLSQGSRRKYAAPLKILFTEAVIDGLLPANPCADVRIIGRCASEEAKAAVPKGQRKPKALPPKYVEPLMGELEQAKRDLLLVLGFTALRVSEVCGLQVQDFGRDEQGRPVLHVQRQWTDGAYKDHPKSAAGVRSVPLDAPLAQRLVKLLAERGNPGPTEPLLPSLSGRPFDDHNIRRALRGASKRLGLPYSVTPHMLRHTVASLLYERGWTDVQVAKLLGHEDANFTRQRYLHVVEDGDVSALGDAYGLGEGS